MTSPVDFDEMDDSCPDCGGDGLVEWDDHPELWGEDCTSLVNHLVPCPTCGGQ